MSPETPPKRMTSKWEGPAGHPQPPALPESSCPSQPLSPVRLQLQQTPTPAQRPSPPFLPDSPLLLGPGPLHPKSLSLTQGDPGPPITAGGREAREAGPDPGPQACVPSPRPQRVNRLGLCVRPLVTRAGSLKLPGGASTHRNRQTYIISLLMLLPPTVPCVTLPHVLGAETEAPGGAACGAPAWL